MDSHEARALLRSRHETGLHTPAYLAQGELIADIHEWMEECMTNERMQHEQKMGVCELGAKIAKGLNEYADELERGDT